MIQRIQTLYLSLIALAAIILLTGDVFYFINESGSAVKLLTTGAIADPNGATFARISNIWPFTALLIADSLFALVTIFLYKNRKIQLLISVFVIVLSSGLMLASVYYPLSIVLKFKVTLVPGFKLIIPPLLLLLSILAYRGIMKDEKLVKSYDRLR